MRIGFLDTSKRAVSETLLHWLTTHIPQATEFRGATGYFSASVLDWLEAPLAAMIAQGGELTLFVGSNQGGTTKADLARLIDVVEPSTTRRVFVEFYDDALFHPKCFVVRSERTVNALVGSANLTLASSLVNIEMGLTLESDRPDVPYEHPIDEIMATLESRERSIPIRDSSDLDRLAALGIIDRNVAAPPRPTLSATVARALSVQRQRRAATGTMLGAVAGFPRRPARPGTAGPRIRLIPATSPVVAGLAFSSNDLKLTGTREFSVSRGIRTWAESVLGRPIVAGEGTLFDVEIEGRLASVPSRVHVTPQRVRIWAAGGSGGTHADVRLVLGSSLREALEQDSIALGGLGLTPGDIGVFELPKNPSTSPVRLSVFQPSDVQYVTLDGMAVRVGREQKRHFTVAALPLIPRWPY